MIGSSRQAQGIGAVGDQVGAGVGLFVGELVVGDLVGEGVTGPETQMPPAPHVRPLQHGLFGPDPPAHRLDPFPSDTHQPCRPRRSVRRWRVETWPCPSSRRRAHPQSDARLVPSLLQRKLVSGHELVEQ